MGIGRLMVHEGFIPIRVHSAPLRKRIKEAQMSFWPWENSSFMTKQGPHQKKDLYILCHQILRIQYTLWISHPVSFLVLTSACPTLPAQHPPYTTITIIRLLHMLYNKSKQEKNREEEKGASVLAQQIKSLLGIVAPQIGVQLECRLLHFWVSS